MTLIVKASQVLSMPPSSDVIEDFVPYLQHNFFVQIWLRIGYDDEKTSSDYHFNVCTPTWLDHSIQNTGPNPGRHTLIVNNYDASAIRKYINKILEESVRKNRDETWIVLSRHFYWEFEDYQPYIEPA